MTVLRGQRALVTGASGGVGRALALRLAHEGVDLVLLARRGDELQATARQARDLGVRCRAFIGDATRADDRLAALDVCQRELGGLDLLVNNAGVGADGRFHESTEESLRTLFEVNLFAAVELTRAAVPLLSESPHGCVANVGSVLGWAASPQRSAYSASKFALRGWCDAVRPELARLGIHVLHASPSTIDSGFRDHLLQKSGKAPGAGRRGVSPERVATAIVRGIARRKSEVAITWEDWAIVRLARFAPWIVERALRRYG